MGETSLRRLDHARHWLPVELAREGRRGDLAHARYWLYVREMRKGFRSRDDDNIADALEEIALGQQRTII